MLTGAIIGAVVGLIVIIMMTFAKEQRFNKVLRTIHDPGLSYAALYHYASAGRFRNALKFFDSYGVLYLAGNTAYYKTSETASPIAFNLAECTVQQEPDWKRMKWFSITTPSGDKYYFNSHKMGAFVNNSDETLKGLTAIKAKTGARDAGIHQPPVFPG